MLLLLLTLGCAEFSSLSVAPAESMATVLEVRWKSSGADRAWVEYGDGFTHIAPEVEGGSSEWHRVLVAGFPQLTDVPLRPVMEFDGERVEGPEELGETGLLPSGVPAFTVTVDDPSGHGGEFILSSAVGKPGGAFILNRDGEVVWYRGVSEELTNTDVWPEAGGVWLNPVDADRTDDVGELIYVGLDGAEATLGPTLLAHHAFEATPGGFAWLSIDVGEDPDGEAAVGDAIMERGPDGSLTERFSTWDYLDYEFTEGVNSNFYPQGLDWTHGNGLSYDADRDSFLYSSRNLSTVLEIDRQTGEVLRHLGKDGGYIFEPPSAGFAHQHAPSWTDEGTLLIFDSRPPGGMSGATRLMELELDDEAGVAEVVWSWTPPEAPTVDALGDLRRLPSGNTLSSWGSIGEIIEIDDEDQIVWRASGAVGVIVGAIYPLESLYPPE